MVNAPSSPTICYLCLSGDEKDPENPLLRSPCACRAPIHAACLWTLCTCYSASIHCTICKDRYRHLKFYRDSKKLSNVGKTMCVWLCVLLFIVLMFSLVIHIVIRSVWWSTALHIFNVSCFGTMAFVVCKLRKYGLFTESIRVGFDLSVLEAL